MLRLRVIIFALLFTIFSVVLALPSNAAIEQTYDIVVLGDDTSYPACTAVASKLPYQQYVFTQTGVLNSIIVKVDSLTGSPPTIQIRNDSNTFLKEYAASSYAGWSTSHPYIKFDLPQNSSHVSADPLSVTNLQKVQIYLVGNPLSVNPGLSSRGKSPSTTYTNSLAYDVSGGMTNVGAVGFVACNSDLYLRFDITAAVLGSFGITSPNYNTEFVANSVQTISGRCYSASSSVAVSTFLAESPLSGYVACTGGYFNVTTTIIDGLNTYRIFDSNYTTSTASYYSRDIQLYGDSGGNSSFGNPVLSITDPTVCRGSGSDFTMWPVTSSARFAFKYFDGYADPIIFGGYKFLFLTVNENGDVVASTTQSISSLDTNFDGRFAYSFAVTSTDWSHYIAAITTANGLWNVSALEFNVRAGSGGGCSNTVLTEGVVPPGVMGRFDCSALPVVIDKICDLVYITPAVLKDSLGSMNVRLQSLYLNPTNLVGGSASQVLSVVSQMASSSIASSSYQISMKIGGIHGVPSTTMKVVDTSYAKSLADGWRPWLRWVNLLFFLIYIWFRFARLLR